MDLDIIEERRDQAEFRTEAYKRKMTKAYNKNVRPHRFFVGDWVLRQTEALKPVRKLEPNWEGPYQVTEVLAKGTYKLADLDDRPVSRPWNANLLKKFDT